MDNFENSVGFISGGTFGIGLDFARTLGQRGMTVVLADVESDALDTARNDLVSQGIQVHTDVLDVRDVGVYREVADRTMARHGQAWQAQFSS